jgi:16S rRNA (guanine527-N7)-methyltransferase
MKYGHKRNEVIAQWPLQLTKVLAQMGLEIPTEQKALLLYYLALVDKWNKVYNLTAVRNPEEMVSRQLLDSLSIAPFIKGPSLLDVGCGAGLPGIPLAIVNPELHVTLIDSNGKKTRFVQQAIAELKLTNAKVIQGRVEDLAKDEDFDTITSRAFADLHLMIRLTKHLLKPNGQWAAMKSGIEELDETQLPEGKQVAIHELHVPGENAARRLLVIT